MATNNVANLNVATQAIQETGTSTTDYVAPGVQQFHASAAKGWCMANVAGAVATHYNCSTVTDVGTGQITFNWDTDFSSINYVPMISVYLTAANVGLRFYAALGAATASAICTDLAGTPTDPINWFVEAFGDQ